jgi:hypothetical protein
MNSRISWNAWLNETVGWRNEYVPRRVAIHHFVKYGLIPFVNSKGYTFACSLSALQSRIATGFYNNQGLSCSESDWRIAVANNDYLEQDVDHYWHIMHSDVWARFWKTWGVWADVSEDSWRGSDRRIDIECFVWTQLNLERSVQTRVVNELVGIYEDYSEERGHHHAREDVYLREAADSGEWGGYRR